MTIERPMFPPRAEAADSAIELVEQFTIQDTFCSGLARIEYLGAVRRLVFYATNVTQHGIEHRLVASLVLPADACGDIAGRLFQAPVNEGPAVPLVDRLRSRAN